jgi:predicted GNAT superfamily acetyltransferase
MHMEIPGDVQSLKAADIGLAGAWRFAVRKTAQTAFASGFRVEAFASAVEKGERRSAYLLRRVRD